MCIRDSLYTIFLGVCLPAFAVHVLPTGDDSALYAPRTSVRCIMRRPHGSWHWASKVASLFTGPNILRNTSAQRCPACSTISLLRTNSVRNYRELSMLNFTRRINSYEGLPDFCFVGNIIRRTVTASCNMRIKHCKSYNDNANKAVTILSPPP